jgi:exopolyphosphatase/guanosine-5'-triphosphate,3'-diphosphate pyrophosphatase
LAGHENVGKVTQMLLGLTFAERAGHPCIGKERADLVPAGCAISRKSGRSFHPRASGC